MSTLLPGVRFRSLRWRLLGSVGIASLLGLLASGVLTFWQARHEAEEMIDGHLAQTARLLMALVPSNESHLAELAAHLASLRREQSSPYETPIEFQIGRSDGSLLLRSQHAPKIALSGAQGYTVIEHHGHPWRMLDIPAAGDYRVQVSQSLELRDFEAMEVAGQAVVPIVLISPLLLLLIYVSIRRGLKPLDDLANDVAARSPDNLKPLTNRGAPLEVQPLLLALNRLLLRLRNTLDCERRFTADAAHELRTPLAIVKIQAQVAESSSDANDRQHALAQIVAGSNRATQALEQLLRLARLDPLAGLPDSAEIDLGELAQRLFAELWPTAEARTAHLQASVPCLRVRGDAELLEIALRNLFDNAIRHTPPDSTITVFARSQHGELSLGVSDDGSGVAPQELPRLAERFYRGRDVNSEGSGLGLAIVQRIAELHDARLQLKNLSDGGFEASLRWSLPPAE